VSTASEPQLLDHEYDGIREYDNPTPGWWHLIFALSIVFSVFYFTFYEYSPLASSAQQDWENNQLEEYRRIFGALGELNNDAPTLRSSMDNQQLMAVARGIFIGNCALCHGTEGAGMAGSNCPNLTDDHWKNVRQVTDIFDVITKGANNGAMPAWENRLSSNERLILSGYVASLRHRPVAGRAAEDEPVGPWFPEHGAPK